MCKVFHPATEVKRQAGWVRPVIPSTAMTFLCLDLGTRRTGLAISDPTGLLARPLTTVPGGESGPALAERLLRLSEEHEVDEIVVGFPRRMSGRKGPEAERTEALVEQLRELLPVPIHLWDERLSTVEAERRLIEAGVRRKKRKAMVDATAAALILQSFLDARGSVRATEAELSR